MAYTTIDEQKKKEQEQQNNSNAAATTAAPRVDTAAPNGQAAAQTAPAQTTPAPVQQATPRHAVTTHYDPNTDSNYMAAMQALDAAKTNMPTYTSKYEAQINDLYNQITGREAFTYDVTSDPLYQQYRDQYANNGMLAMKDTMGQAAALTGGYGSSYGQNVGQQQYNAYLQKLNEVVPELYGMAYQQYQDEGNALMQQYGMMGDMADEEYGKYQDAMAQYWQNVNYLQGQADDAYNRGYRDWQDGYAMQQDAYDRLVDMMTGLGYNPTAEELAAAGMSDGQMQAYLNYYAMMHPTAPASSGGSGGGGGSGKKDTWSLIKADLDGGTNLAEINSDIMRDTGLSAAERAELVSKATNYAKPEKNIAKHYSGPSYW